MQPSAEERVGRYKKTAKESVASTSKRKSKEMETDLEARIAGWQEENKKVQKQAKHKEIMTELRGKLKKRAEEKKKLKEEDEVELTEEDMLEVKPIEKESNDDYESYEVTGGEVEEKPKKSKLITSEQSPVVSGEINNEFKPGKTEAVPVEMVKSVEVEKPADKAAMAAKDERTMRSLEKTRAALKRFDERTDKILAERARVKAEADRQQAKESRSDEARTDYVGAYKKYDPRFTKNKSDDQIAKTKPPFFAFGKAARELKRLYGVMVRAEDSRVGGLSPGARKAIADSARKEEEEFIASSKKFAAKKETEDR